MARTTLIAATALVVAGASATTLAAATAPSSILWAGKVPSATVTRTGSTTSVAVPSSAPLAWFTDRPERRSGTTTVKGLAANWTKWGFTADPPNAAIAIGSGRRQHTYVVTLSHPRITSTRTTFQRFQATVNRSNTNTAAPTLPTLEQTRQAIQQLQNNNTNAH